MRGIARAKRRLPPFGKQLADALERGLRPRNDVKLYVGRGAWDAARMAQLGVWVALAMPDGSKPDEFRWPVAGLGVVVFEMSHQGAERLQRLALHLLQAGACVVRVVHCGGNLSIYRPGGES